MGSCNAAGRLAVFVWVSYVLRCADGALERGSPIGPPERLNQGALCWIFRSLASYARRRQALYTKSEPAPSKSPVLAMIRLPWIAGCEVALRVTTSTAVGSKAMT